MPLHARGASAKYAAPDLVVYLCPSRCYLALSAASSRTTTTTARRSRTARMNQAFGNWLSVFYGYPTFAWIPTHNLNHHKLVNKAGDATITWRYTNRHNALVAVDLLLRLGYCQSEPIKAFIRKAAAQQPRALPADRHRSTCVWAGAHAALLALGHRAARLWARASSVWVFALRCCRRSSRCGRSCSSTTSSTSTPTPGRRTTTRAASPASFINFLLFNNGLHAAHHEHAGAALEQAAASSHAKIEAEIHPDLKPRSFWWFCLKRTCWRRCSRGFGTKQIGRAPFDPPTGDAGR